MNNAQTLPRLFLVRHGDTDWTDWRKHTGLSDIPLNEKGEERARRLAPRLRGDFARVFSSPLVRARRTSELTGFGGRAELTSDLVEWNYGDYDGRTTAEILRDRPGWNLFHHGAPNGESADQVAARADHFLSVVRGIDGDVLAFSSGHIIRMIAARWLGLSPQNAGHFYTATASIGILGYEHDMTEPVILLWNDTRSRDGND